MCEEDININEEDVNDIEKPYLSSFNHDDNPPPEFC